MTSSLYRNMRKRFAKKRIGVSWRKLLYGLQLKPGDLISSCRGYNERIAAIYPLWTSHNLKKGRYIFDFDLALETGGDCSLIHCCSFPLETREQIERFWREKIPD